MGNGFHRTIFDQVKTNYSIVGVKLMDFFYLLLIVYTCSTAPYNTHKDFR